MKLLAAVASLVLNSFGSTDYPQIAVSRSRAASDQPSALEAALAANWDASRQGPLIAVDPGTVRPIYYLRAERNPRMRQQQPPQPPAPGAPLKEVADWYGRQLMRTGSLTVLAPVEMVVLNTKLGDPDIYASLPRDLLIRVFEASLTEGQWRKLGGPDGIGLDDLKREQQRLFLATLPDPFSVRKAVMQAVYLQDTRDPPVVLTPEERQRVRLRLTREPTFAFPAANRPDTWLQFNHGRPRAEGDVVLTLENAFRRATNANGSNLADYQPNRLKPGDLRFDLEALGRGVSLVPLEGKPLTVGDLVKRVSIATRLELYADVRVADLPLWVAGSSAAGGEVLRALCLAVTGTFRRVGTAYVLTDDLQGIGERRLLISEWVDDARLMEEKLRTDAERVLAQQKPERFIGFAPDAKLPLGAAQLGGVSPAWHDRLAHAEGIELGMADLPADWQAVLQREIARGNGAAEQQRPRNGTFNPGSDMSVRGDRVHIGVDISMSYLVPGLGEIREGGTGFGVSSVVPRSARPNATARPKPRIAMPDYPVRALHIGRAEPADLERLASAAKAHGFNQLWVEVPEKGGRELLNDAVVAAERHGLAFAPVVRLLFGSAADADAPPAEGRSLDVNIRGETASEYRRRRANAPQAENQPTRGEPFLRRGDWLRIDTQEARAEVQRRIYGIAGAAGVAAIILRDTASPGFTDPGDHGFGGSRSGWEFGYTPQNRLAFLRQWSVDPIDLPGQAGNFGWLAELPFFPDSKIQAHFIGTAETHAFDTSRSALPQWDHFRYELNTGWVRSLYAGLRAKAPNLPLMVERRGAFPMWLYPGWYAYWEDAEKLPALGFGEVLGKTEAQALRLKKLRSIASYDFARWTLSPPPREGEQAKMTDEERFAWTVAVNLEYDTENWQGVELDVSGVPVEQAIRIVNAFAAAVR